MWVCPVGRVEMGDGAYSDEIRLAGGIWRLEDEERKFRSGRYVVTVSDMPLGSAESPLS
jgi:hypothetical protein